MAENEPVENTNSINLMKFFVSREDGTSSLLATALDPKLNDDRQRDFRKKFCNHLKEQSSEVDLSLDGPSLVLTEYDCMDIVMVWGDWIVVVENKVSSATLNEKQLSRYYQKVLSKSKKRIFLAPKHQEKYKFTLDHKDLKNKRICILFVTPSEKMGKLALALKSVELRPTDAKLSLSWESIIEDLKLSFPENNDNDPFGRIIRDAVVRTNEILVEHHKRDSKIDFTEERFSTRDFLEQVKLRIKSMKPLPRGLKLRIQHDHNLDILKSYCGRYSGVVRLQLRVSHTSLNPDSALLKGWMEFTMAGSKAFKKRSKEFISIPVEHWAERLHVDANDLTYAKEKCCVAETKETEWKDDYGKVVEQVAEHFHGFLKAFQPFMVPQKVASE